MAFRLVALYPVEPVAALRAAARPLAALGDGRTLHEKPMRPPGHVAAHAAGQVGEVAERQKVVAGDFHEGVVTREGVETFDHGVAGRLQPRPRLGGVRPSAGDFAVEGVQGASEILHALDQRLRDLLFAQLSRARLPHVGGPEVVGQGNTRPDLDQAVAQAHGQRVVEAGGEAAVRFQHRLNAHAVENGGFHLFLGDDRSQRLVPPEKETSPTTSPGP